MALRAKNFWAKELPALPADRLLSLLRVVWRPDSETDFLSFASNLLLESAEALDQPFFREPLAHCEFRPLNLRLDASSHRMAPSIMTPLFADTLVYDAGDDGTGAGGAASTRRVKATQKEGRMRLFTPTLASSTMEAFSLSASGSASISSLSSSSSSHSSFSSSSHFRAPGAKARFLSSSMGEERDAAIRIQLAKKKAKAKSLREKSTRIQMYRDYRQGDFPDIEKLTISDFTVPLLSLASQDPGSFCWCCCWWWW